MRPSFSHEIGVKTLYTSNKDCTLHTQTYTSYKDCTRHTKTVHVIQRLYTSYKECTRHTKIVHVIQRMYTSYKECTRHTKSVHVIQSLHTSYKDKITSFSIILSLLKMLFFKHITRVISLDFWSPVLITKVITQDVKLI